MWQFGRPAIQHAVRAAVAGIRVGIRAGLAADLAGRRRHRPADGAATTVLHDVRRLVRHQPQVVLALTVAERDAFAFGIGAGANGGGGGTRGRAGIHANIGQWHAEAVLQSRPHGRGQRLAD
jgi:hypothetical protein